MTIRTTFKDTNQDTRARTILVVELADMVDTETKETTITTTEASTITGVSTTEILLILVTEEAIVVIVPGIMMIVPGITTAMEDLLLILTLEENIQDTMMTVPDMKNIPDILTIVPEITIIMEDLLLIPLLLRTVTIVPDIQMIVPGILMIVPGITTVRGLLIISLVVIAIKGRIEKGGEKAFLRL